MQHFINSTKVKRNALLARVLSFGGLGTMGLGLLISLRPPYQVDLVLALFVIGILASQIGLPMRNRWDRRPRIDELLDDALKGLDRRFAIFHYSLGARHVLVCPGGVFALIPRLESGQIDYLDGQWTRTIEKGGLFTRAGTRPIRSLEREALSEADRATSAMKLSFPARPFIVFLHGAAEVQIGDSPFPASHVKKLKSSLRKLPKAETLSEKQISVLIEEHNLT